MDNQPETAWQAPLTDATAKKPSTQRSKALRPLTRKQQAFIKHLVNNPKDSATKAVQATYNTRDYSTAGSIAVENLQKPAILTELAKYSGSAENTVITVMDTAKQKMVTDDRQGSNWGTLALQSANSLLDRVHGKATQKTESVSTGVTLTIDLTSALDTTDSTQQGSDTTK